MVVVSDRRGGCSGGGRGIEKGRERKRNDNDNSCQCHKSSGSGSYITRVSSVTGDSKNRVSSNF